MSNRTVAIDEAKCTGCGACIKVCAEGAITLYDGVAHINQSLCTACLNCIGACPNEAIAVTEVVALTQRPPSDVGATLPKTKTASRALASLGGMALAYVIDRVLPTLLDRALQSGVAKPGGQKQTPASRQENSSTGYPPDMNGRGRRRRRRGRWS